MWQLPNRENTSGLTLMLHQGARILVHLFWGFFFTYASTTSNLTPEDVMIHCGSPLGLPSESVLVIQLEFMVLRVMEDLWASQCKIHLGNGSAVLMLVCYSGEMQLLGLLLHAMRTINGRIQSLRRNTMGILKWFSVAVFHSDFAHAEQPYWSFPRSMQ